ncbi:MAG: glycosyltransferase family 1 protein [Anaerolineales bacterium]|nr:glycosyltransferase family 1 protein [Anaerolineales bacterium]MCB9103342.1 glycosyltransferase family 1 protein [Anaerolineales bacterium]
MPLRVAVVQWTPKPDEVAQAISEELHHLNYEPTFFRFDQKIPADQDAIFTYAPWGRVQQFTHQLQRIPAAQRPAWAHWNFESPPDIRLPKRLSLTLGQFRSAVDRLNDVESDRLSALQQHKLVQSFNHRLAKFRYVGDYWYARQQEALSVYAEISQVYADFYNALGLKTIYAPWGVMRGNYADLGLERDIDVLWIGTRRTRYRSRNLDRIRSELAEHGVEIYVVDGVERKPVFGEARTELINRAKITLSLLPTWYDAALVYRFPLVAANKTLVVSDNSLAHNPLYINHRHYAAAPVDKLAETILYYLAHDQEREAIAENGYKLVTEELKLGRGVAVIMEAVEQSLSKSRSEINP